MDQRADAADVEAVLGGDADAFERIVERWQGPLFRLALRYCANREEAEDLTQDIFLHAFRSLPRWRRASSFSTWLFAVASNVARSHARSARPASVALDEQVAAVDRGDEHEGLGARVRRALGALPRRYREVLDAFYGRELDVRSTSRALDLPEGTVKARLARGRKLLGRLLSSKTER